MTIDWKENKTKSRAWQPVRTAQKDTWVDGAGVEWDIDYVTRFERLQAALRGTVTCAWHPEYEETRRSWLDAVERWPAAMVLCLVDDDIETCCAYAQKYDLPITLRGAHHMITEQSVSDGALVIDMSLVR